MSMFNDISCGTKDNEEECLANVKLVSLCAKRFGKGQWSFIGPCSENDTRSSTWFLSRGYFHDGTAQSVMNEETPRDRSGRPDIDSQRGAWPQQFVIGNDEAEL